MSDDMTTGEGDAWRAYQAACVARLREMAAGMRRWKEPAAAHYDQAADAIERMPSPAEMQGLLREYQSATTAARKTATEVLMLDRARREPTGLDYRGG